MKPLGRLLAAFGVFASALPGLLAAPRAELLAPAHAWQKAEFRVVEVPTVTNPFDPEHIRVDATIVAPSGRRTTLPAFWYQAYERRLSHGAEQLTPIGPPEWRIRLTATEPGSHRLSVQVQQPGAPAAVGPETWFDVGPAQVPEIGWVRISEDRRTFSLDGRRPLLLTGHNVCWPGPAGTHQYEEWFKQMATSGQNFARLWLAPWWAPLEHVPGTLTNYRLDAAWQLDRVFAAAEEQGLYLLLCLDHHGMYQPFDPTWGGSNAYWRTNPYSTEQGGPCAHPSEFFQLPAAKQAYQKRLRYLIARYGYSPRLVAWQFFNEIDNIFDRAPVDEATVVAWHAEMARWLRANDPYEHVIGTSLTGGVDRPAFWQLPEMEFTSYHAYWEPAPARRVGALARDFTERYQKPALIGEFGVSGAHWDAPSDPHLRGFRQHLWGGTLGGAASVPLAWWWDDVHADGGLQLERALTDFLRQAGWFEGGWSPLALEPQAGGAPSDLEGALPDSAPFAASLSLNPFRRLRLAGNFAVANPLAAERASEYLSAVLWGARTPEMQVAQRVTVWAGDQARAVIRVAETTGAAELVARLDGAEVERSAFAAAGPASRDLVVALPAGKRTLELSNVGEERIQLASLRFEGLQPATYTGGWTFRPEAIGLRRGNRAMVYVVAPAAVYPAGAIRYALPVSRGGTITLSDWNDGPVLIRWIDPATGRELAQDSVTASGGRLRVAIPEFTTDLAALIAGR